MFPRLTAAIHRRGSAPPDLPGIFLPKRMISIAAACCLLLGLPSAVLSQTNLVFQTDEAHLEVIAEKIEPIFMQGQPSVQFELDALSSTAFSNLTAGIVGETLTISLCNRPLLEVIVRERLDGRGILNLPTIEAAIAVTDVVQGKADCASLAEHFDE